MRPQVVWTKWKDPLLSNYDETEWPGYDLDENGDKIPIHTAERQPIMHTPFGVVSVVNDSMAATQFDFWVMHTNFTLTESMMRVIESVEGVETLEPYTRYRARLGFPRSGLFKAGDVMHNVQQALMEVVYYEQNQLLSGLEIDVAKRAMETRDQIDKKYNYWTMWVVPNGHIEIVGSDKTDEEYVNKSILLKRAHESVGGRLLTSSERTN